MRKQKKQRPPVENQPHAPLETAPADEAAEISEVPAEVVAEAAVEVSTADGSEAYRIDDTAAPVANYVANDVVEVEAPAVETAPAEADEAESAEKTAPETEFPLYVIPAPDLPAPEAGHDEESAPPTVGSPLPEAEAAALADPEPASVETPPETLDAGPVPDIRDIAEVEELVEDGSGISIPVVPAEPAKTVEEQPAPEELPLAEAAAVAAAVAATAAVVQESDKADETPADATDAATPAAASDSAPATPTKAVVASSFADKCFNALAWLGPLAALLFLAAQTLPGIDLRALVEGETVLPALLESMKQGADPLLLLLNGAPYPDLPPTYFWFLAGLDSLWQLTPLPYSMPLLLLGSSVVAGFLLLLMTWALARVCGSDVREAFAACAVLLCTVAVCAMTRLALPDLLFAACVAASCLCLYSGWMRTRAPLTLLLGFLLAGLAMLIEGPVGLVLPLGASLLFLLWRGTFRRAGAIDGAFGFAVLLVAIGGWLAWLGLTYGRGPAEALLNFHIPQWSLAFWSDPQLWPEALLMLGALLLPWPLLLLFLPWERLYRLPVLLWRNRRENPGIGFVWSGLLVGLGILSFTCTGGTSGFAPLLPFLAVILGRAVLRLSPLRSKGFFGLVGLILFVGAVALGLCSALPFLTDWLPAGLALPEACKAIADLPGMPFVAGAALLFAFILLKVTNKTFPGGGLLVLVLFATVVMQPVAVFTLPALAPLNATAPEAPTASAAPEAAATPAASETPATAETPAAPAETPAASTTQQAPVAPEAPATAPAETSAPAEAPAAAPAPETPAAPAS